MGGGTAKMAISKGKLAWWAASRPRTEPPGEGVPAVCVCGQALYSTVNGSLVYARIVPLDAVLCDLLTPLSWSGPGLSFGGKPSPPLALRRCPTVGILCTS